MEIIAASISNLTDARYFAAMGVDWIIFDLAGKNALSLEKMHAIMEWVEGPRYGLNISGAPAAIINQVSLESRVDLIIQDEGQNYNLGNARTVRVIRYEQMPRGVPAGTATLAWLQHPLDLSDPHVLEGLRELCSNMPCWLSHQNLAVDLDYLLESVPLAGVVLSGGTEEQVGIKSYEDTDDLLEALEKYR